MQPTHRGRLLVSLSLLLLISIALAACGSEPAAPAAPVATPLDEVAQVTPMATEPPAATAPVATSEEPEDTPVPAPAETAAATDTAPPPTDTVAPPTDTPEPAPVVVSAFGQTEDGLYFRGSPAAAVTVVDYSDFL